MKLIEIFNRKIFFAAFIILMIVSSNILSYKFFGRSQQNKPVNDDSSIYSADDAVTLLTNIAKKICTKSTSASVTVTDFDNIITDCLNNIRNQAVTFENSLKNFWNICVDYVKNKSDDAKKKIDQGLIESLIGLIKNSRVSISKNHGSSCNNMVVIGTFNQAEVISEIVAFLAKFKLDSKPTGTMISSAIGVHRNMADGSFFSKLNGGQNTNPTVNAAPATKTPSPGSNGGTPPVNNGSAPVPNGGKKN